MWMKDWSRSCVFGAVIRAAGSLVLGCLGTDSCMGDYGGSMKCVAPKGQRTCSR
jgi:hypothetical protein